MSPRMFKRVELAVLVALALCVVATQAVKAAPPQVKKGASLRARIEAAKQKAAYEAKVKQSEAQKKLKIAPWTGTPPPTQLVPTTMRRKQSVKKTTTQSNANVARTLRRSNNWIVGRKVAPAPMALSAAAKKKKKAMVAMSQPRRMRLSTPNSTVRNSTPQSSSTRQTAQTSAESGSSARPKREFLELHAEYYADIKQRRDELSAKLAHIDQLAGQITGSRYVGLRSHIRIWVNFAQTGIGQYGSYTNTFDNTRELRVPDEHKLDLTIDKLEDYAKALEDRADDADDEAMEDLAEALDDLIDDADRLEGRLTSKTNRLKHKWRHKGGEVSYF